MFIMIKTILKELTMIKDVTYDVKKQQYIIILNCGVILRFKDYIAAKNIIDKKYAA